ncbi:MAG: radical SAM protein, partial [Candidatus Omnitrophota bacterium]
MINITKLLCDLSSYGDELRYKKGMTAYNRRPIVVWNCSRKCNLSCIHCYSNSANADYEGELSTQEAKKMIDDLAEFKVPVLLFSGGEPLLRQDLFELNDYAHKRNIKTVISTNGTLIDNVLARRIKDASVDYVGVSLDG